MHADLEDLALWATAKKGNHAVLWIAFGIIASVNLVTGFWDGRTMVPDPLRCWLFGYGIREVALKSEPFLFLGWMLTMCVLALVCLAIGFIAISARARRRKQRHPFADIVSK